jgi:hypothetical protein
MYLLPTVGPLSDKFLHLWNWTHRPTHSTCRGGRPDSPNKKAFCCYKYVQNCFLPIFLPLCTYPLSITSFLPLTLPSPTPSPDHPLLPSPVSHSDHPSLSPLFVFLLTPCTLSLTLLLPSPSYLPHPPSSTSSLLTLVPPPLTPFLHSPPHPYSSCPFSFLFLRPLSILPLLPPSLSLHATSCPLFYEV